MAFRNFAVVDPWILKEAALKVQRISTAEYEEDPFEAADLQTAYLLWGTP